MTLTLQEISDRLEIQDALLAYSTALDVPGRRWDQWYQAFTPAAVLEYGGVPKSAEEVKEQFKLNDAVRLTTQHLFMNIVISIDGDTATARSECSYAAVNRGDTPGKNTLRLSGVWFADELVRTPEGWRINHRVANSRWSHAVEIDAT